MENSTEVLKAVISGNAAQLNEILQSLNSTERVSVLAAQDYTDKALEKKNVIRIPCKTTPLIVAVQNGNLDCVKLLLNYKADIEEQGESFKCRVFQPDAVIRSTLTYFPEFESPYTGPPLFLAAANGNLDILSYLFEQGANVNASSSAHFSGLPHYSLHWYTPLIVALKNGHNDAFTFLIDKGADVNLQDHQGYIALHYAVETKNFDAVSCLVYNGADVNLFTSFKCTPLMLACQSDNMDAINFLLNKGADVNLQGHQGYTALHYAVARKNFDAVSCLVHNGADVNLFTSCKHTPLMLACQSHKKDAINFLLNKGADVNLQDHDGYTALHYAVKRKNFDAVSCLVHNRADVNLFTSSKQTPLMMACQSHDMETVNFLVNKGADVNLQDRDGQSALHFASSDICYWLIQNLADVNMCDNHNCTPLMLASRNSDVKKVAMLIENGAKVDLQDGNGNTALHHAMLNSDDSLEYTPEICLALLTAKASNLCNSQGWTPLLLASKNCIKSVVEKFSKQPEVTKEQKANALELLGASLRLKSPGTFVLLGEDEGFNYIWLGMKERFADNSHPLLKQQVEPAEAYQNRRECQTLEELAEIEEDDDAIIMESLVIRERIIGANNVELLKPIERVAGHFYSMGPDHFKRLSIPLYRYATKIAQECIEECFESAVSCLWHLTYALYGYEEYSDKELLLELLELTVFLCENWRDYNVYQQSVWHVEYDDEEVSLFDSVEVVIHMITKNLQNDEEDETYSNVLVLLRKLLRHNPRCRNDNGTLLHVRTYSTEEIITDIVPSADTVKLLLNAGFNVHVNAIDCDGDTPLHRAACLEPGDDLIHQVPEIMNALFYGGAHHDFVNNDSKTPKDMAETDEACMILSAAEGRKLELKCISAKAVKKFGIPYLGEVPKTLEKYISMH